MVSIIIPTKNGQDYLQGVLEAVFKQKTDFEFEVIIVDSGSTDKTLGIIEEFRNFTRHPELVSGSNKMLKQVQHDRIQGDDRIQHAPRLKLYQIPAQEFNHGTTRNLAASKAAGEYLVFLTLDAAPANENWLANIVRPLIQDEEVAGVFGKHLPRKNCDPFQKKTLGEFFNSFGKATTVWQLNNLREQDFEKNKHILTYFSNVNSAIRKSVWEKIPFQEVQMGEDQFWAKEIILAGYKKVYEPKAAVEHSHNYGIYNQFKRWFDEYRQHKINQNYIGVNSWLKILPLTCRLTLNDIKYISTQKDYRWEQKIYWSIWIFFINLARFGAQYFGGHYERLPLSLQNKLSMQYQMIHKKF